MTRLLPIVAVALATLLLSPPLWSEYRGHRGHNDDMEDYERARQLVSEGAILPLNTILEKAELGPGSLLLEVEFEREDGRWVYELEILKERGEVVELLYDAATGEFLGIDD